MKNPSPARDPSTIVNRTVTPRRPRNADLDSLLQRLSGTTVQEIDHFIAELQALRQRLQHEATRVERKVVQYASLNEAARASMRTISENLSF